MGLQIGEIRLLTSAATYNSVPAGPFASNAALVLKEALVNGCGIEAPTCSKEGNLIDVGVDAILHSKRKGLCRISIFETFEAQLPFGGRGFTLVPEGPAGPGVSAENAAMICLDPGMVMQNRTGVEELDTSEFATHFQEETEAGVDVVVRFGQARAEDNDPTFDGWGDEQFFVAGKSLNPRTRFGIVEAQSRLNRLRVAALNRQPGRGTNPPDVAVGRNKLGKLNGFERTGGKFNGKRPAYRAPR